MSDQGLVQPLAPGAGEEDEGGSQGAVVLLASVAALGGFLFGYDSAVINGAVGAIFW